MAEHSDLVELTDAQVQALASLASMSESQILKMRAALLPIVQFGRDWERKGLPEGQLRSLTQPVKVVDLIAVVKVLDDFV